MPTQKLIASTVYEMLPVTFSKENTQAITEMIGRYGSDGEDVVINALILLYTIFQKCPDAKTIVAQGASGQRVVIPLP
jgi:hypothetical protein